MKTLDRLLQAAGIRKAKPGSVPEDASWTSAVSTLLCSRHSPIVSGVVSGSIVLDRVSRKALGAPPREFPAPHDLEDEFDAITVLAVLEHVPDADLGDFALECARLLAPGGPPVLTVHPPSIE